MHPYIGAPTDRVTFSDEQVASAMLLLRRYHDTFGPDVVCHGDFGPWNLVWRSGLPVAIIDFDKAYPGDPGDDVAYALRMFRPNTPQSAGSAWRFEVHLTFKCDHLQ